MKPIAVIGEGGHSKVVQDTIQAMGEYQLIALLDDKYTEPSKEGKVILAPVSYAFELMQIETKVQLVIAIGNNRVRKQIAERLAAQNARFAVLIHPTAVLSPSAVIKEGTVVMPNTVINADAEIGRHVIINTSAVIEHDNFVGDYAHVSPGAILTGNVTVGEGTQIGAGATVIPGNRIGQWSMIGAGSTVITNIADEVTAVGAPARVIG
ncbi:acetyltransferase [Bacillus aerolatus]|uniref:Acetyltransferase n=1 Tax=Bacillus aerolatus TaxID=2653354 RepID=A0A6I1FGR2_9BACI|nr:acetyltransferase [Bacillus aerolatus]KAB7707375.1 acetyltransferase [Bacillus aerolatus]